MRTQVLGLHHVTATVDDAQNDLDFAAGTLGLRLVKKTVNFDNHHVFHFYYGDDRGRPGTLWTTFPYKGYGVRPGVKGVGQITATAFSVPPDALTFWRPRLDHAGIEIIETTGVFDERVLLCRDPSGLVIALAENGQDQRTPWTTPETDARVAIRGLHSVTITIASPPATLDFMQRVLGFEIVRTAAQRTRLAVGGDAAGHWIDVLEAPGAPAAVNGLGTVHHVAMIVQTDDDQLRLRAELVKLGVPVTPVMDRQYFHSIYFREPGGVLFEIATAAPGFLVDEPLDALGLDLKLPPWEETVRPDIEAGLPRVTMPHVTGNVAP